MENETYDSRQSDLKLDLFNGEDQPEPNKFDVSEVRLEDLITNNEISADALDSQVAAGEDDSSREEGSDKNFKDYIEQKSILEEGDDEEAKEEEISVEMSRTFSKIIKNITIESDVDEVNEEMEETETPESKDFQQPERMKMALTSATEMASTEALLKQAKSKLILRAASILERRLKTISGLKDLFEERKKLGFKNRFLNDKCCEYLKKATTVNHFESTAGALPIHGNQRYYNILEEFMDMKIHYDNTKPSLEEETQNLMDSYYICRARFEQVFGELISRELEVGSECIDGKTGKVMNEQKLRSLVKKQERRFNQLAEVRVYYLKLHNLLARIHKNLRVLNSMGEGHTLMEYEQLMIINNSSMDKLDEREEELRKLREKCTEDISILSYMKETSEAFAHDIIDVAVELEEVTKKKNEARSLLAFQCLKRDLLRKDTLKIHSATGLLTSPILLGKMEVNSEALTVLKRKMDKTRHGDLDEKR